MKQGADYIECDVQVTKDLQLYCSHNPWLSKITQELSSDIKFSGRKRRETVLYEDAYRKNEYVEWNVTDWFIYDFTAEELNALKRIQPDAHRDPNYNLKETFCSFQEYIDIAKEHKVGIYPEIKYPYFVNSILTSRGHNITLEELMIIILNDNGYTDKTSNCFIQSFEKKSLENIAGKTKLKRIYLLWEDEKHLKNLDIEGRLQRNKDMWKDAIEWGKKENIDGFGLDKGFIMMKNKNDYLSNTYTYMLEDASEHGFLVHIYTLAHDKGGLLPWDFGKDPFLEYKYFLELGLDGYFSDFPAIAHTFLAQNNTCNSSIAPTSNISNFLLLFLLGFILQTSWQVHISVLTATNF